MAQEQRPSLRYDAALRACRDGDLKTLRELIDHAQLFRDVISLKRACESGEWGRGTTTEKQGDDAAGYDTQDSIRLHTLLQTATTRGHEHLVVYLLSVFPARELHYAEWEVVVNALGTGRVTVVRPFLELDPEIAQWADDRIGGTVFGIIARLVEDWEGAKEVCELLLSYRADINISWNRISALTEVIQEQRPNMVRWLVQHGASPTPDDMKAMATMNIANSP